jgi:kynurenine formamidase
MATANGPIAALASSLGAGEIEIVDLTYPLGEDTLSVQLPEPYAQSPVLELHEISRYDERGPHWAWNWLTIGEHVGTHMDAPIHWITGRDGADLASIAAERLVGPACVLDITAEVRSDPSYLVTMDDLRAFEASHGELPEGGWLLLRTGFDLRAPEARFNDTPRPGFGPDAARWLAEESGIVGVGVDTTSVDAAGAGDFDPPAPAHRAILGAGKHIVEQLANVDRLPPAGALVVVAPMPIVGGTGSPTRVIALVPRS